MYKQINPYFSCQPAVTWLFATMESQKIMLVIMLRAHSQKWTDHPRHDDVMARKHFACYWPFVKGIHWSPLDFPHKGVRPIGTKYWLINPAKPGLSVSFLIVTIQNYAMVCTNVPHYWPLHEENPPMISTVEHRSVEQRVEMSVILNAMASVRSHYNGIRAIAAFTNSVSKL